VFDDLNVFRRDLYISRSFEFNAKRPSIMTIGEVNDGHIGTQFRKILLCDRVEANKKFQGMMEHVGANDAATRKMRKFFNDLQGKLLGILEIYYDKNGYLSNDK
jgi:hypothetical protein